MQARRLIQLIRHTVPVCWRETNQFRQTRTRNPEALERTQ